MKSFADGCREHLESFVDKCCKNDRIPYIKKGVLNIEGFYWWSLVGHFKPDIILESGVASGRSTEILARAQLNFSIPQHYAFDIDEKHKKLVSNKLSRYRTVYQIKSSIDGFSEVLKENPKARIVAIVDGPKSGDLFSKLLKTISGFENMCAAGFHDCDPGEAIYKNLIKFHNKLFKNKSLIFTDKLVNNDLQHLNEYIRMDIPPENFQELIKKSNCIGIIA